MEKILGYLISALITAGSIITAIVTQLKKIKANNENLALSSNLYKEKENNVMCTLVREYCEEAEKMTNWSGEEKREYVLAKVQVVMFTSHYAIPAESDIEKEIERLLKTTKKINYKESSIYENRTDTSTPDDRTVKDAGNAASIGNGEADSGTSNGEGATEESGRGRECIGGTTSGVCHTGN